MAFGDAGARANPLVVGIDDLFKIVVGDHLCWDMVAPPDDVRVARPWRRWRVGCRLRFRRWRLMRPVGALL
jgi:hypothetical protein